LRLLHVVAIACGGPANVALAASLAPAPGAFFNANRFRGHRVVCGGGLGIIAMDANEVTAQIMFTAKGATARGVGANMGLKSVGVVCRHVGLQVVRTRECPGASTALVLFTGITLELIERTRSGWDYREGVGDVRWRDGRLNDARIVAQLAVVV